MRGHKNLALVLRPLTHEELKEYGYSWMEDGDLHAILTEL